ncbi:MAG: peptide ABC transporter substrate-binding protein [Planctomycetota bacterium]
MFRVLMIVTLLSLALVAAVITTAQDSTRGDFVYAEASDLNTLDPAQMSWTKDIRIAINIWEGLTTYHPQTTEPMEGAAYFPPDISSDGLTYEFNIRPDARWSNGERVTAGDFVRGWRRAIEPGTAMDYAGLLMDHIAGLREYYEWRNRAVSVLTALSRLAGGWTIDAAGARALYEHTDLPEITTAAGRLEACATAGARPGRPTGRDRPAEASPAREVGRETAEGFYRALADDLSARDADWTAIHREWLHRHAGECDEHFARTGIRAVNDSTLRLTLVRPCVYFLDLCAFPTFVPIHESIERLREHFDGVPLTREGLVIYDQQWTKPAYPVRGYVGLITNGPYRLAEWSFKRRVRLVRNPHHRDYARTACATIDRVAYSDANTAVMAYEAGEVDFLPDMRVHYDHRLIELAVQGLRPDLHNPVVLATHFCIFNCRDAEVLGRPNPLLDVRVRRAFNLATDKKLLVEKVLQRGEPASGNLVPVGSIPGYASPTPLGYDPAEARRLLAEAGYPGGAGLPPIDLLYSTAGGDEKMCEVLARMWGDALGVRVELRAKEPKTFAEDKVNGTYMIAQANWYGDYNDPTTFLDIFRAGNGNNDAGYANLAYDELLDSALGTPHAAQGSSSRMALLARAEAILIRDDCPLLPLYQLTNLMAIKPSVRGLYPNPRLLYPFRYVRITSRKTAGLRPCGEGR